MNEHLGRCDVCLNVADVRRSLEFYQAMGFRQVGGKLSENWAVLACADFRLGLYQGHIDGNMLNFRGGDVFRIAAFLKEQGLTLKSDARIEADGSAGATIEDPDGNVIYFNTAPGEEPGEEPPDSDSSKSRGK